MPDHSQTFTGLRMMDVRQKIAAAGSGLERVDKINAGRYTVITLDGRRWIVMETVQGTWQGYDDVA